MRESPTRVHWTLEKIPDRTEKETDRYVGNMWDIVCYICQRKGHKSMDCQARECHISRECKEYGRGTKYRSMECYNCGRICHLAIECKGYRGYEKNHQNKNKTCFECGEAGHFRVYYRNKGGFRAKLNEYKWKQSDF